jgi:hypothetical protein
MSDEATTANLTLYGEIPIRIPPPDEELKLIADAMHWYVSQIMRNRRLRSKRRARPEIEGHLPPEKLTVWTMGSPDKYNKATTAFQRQARDICDKPLEYAYRRTFKTLGERAWEILEGDHDKIVAFVERIANRNRKLYYHRVAFMDHAMDGVGRCNGNPGWCC